MQMTVLNTRKHLYRVQMQSPEAVCCMDVAADPCTCMKQERKKLRNHQLDAVN